MPECKWSDVDLKMYRAQAFACHLESLSALAYYTKGAAVHRERLSVSTLSLTTAKEVSDARDQRKNM